MWFKKRRIYADAAAATPLSRRARRELIRLLGAFGNSGALHREALEAKGELEAARKTIADSIGAHPDEIVFTASGTEANNLAIQGLLRHLLLRHGELHAITSAIEHQSVLAPLRALEREGLPVRRVNEDLDAPSFATWGVPGTPFVVYVVDGRAAAKGLVNTLEQIEELIEVGEERVGAAA